jgi:hypothetical protein
MIASKWGWFSVIDPNCTWPKLKCTPKPIPGHRWWRVELAPRIELTFVFVDGGSFVFAPPQLTDRVDQVLKDRIGQTLTVKEGFWIGQIETPFYVVKHWLETAKPTSRKATSQDAEESSILERMQGTRIVKEFWNHPNEYSPAVRLSLDEFTSCCRFYSERLNKAHPDSSSEMSLPDITQFELALRAKAQTCFHFGSSSLYNLVQEYALPHLSVEDDLISRRPLANWSKLPNRMGLFNAIGNVGEFARALPEERHLQENVCWWVGGTAKSDEAFHCGNVTRTQSHLTFLPAGVRFTLMTDLEKEQDTKSE